MEQQTMHGLPDHPGQGAQTSGHEPVSIALATYNGALYIEEQLESLVNQTRPPAEIVISDDGSTDDTLKRIAAFASRCAIPIRILPNGPRLGFADNFLRAAHKCTSNLIAFCDQDDVWMPEKLAKGVEHVVRSGALLSMHHSTLTDGELTPYGVLTQGIPHDRVIAPLDLNPYATGWGNTMLFRRHLLDVFEDGERPRQPEAERMLSHDTWLLTLAAALGPVAQIAEPLLLYRQHGANALGAVMPGLPARLARMFVVPLHRYQEQLAFYESMKVLFTTLAGRNAELSLQAERAAAAYGARAEIVRDRLALYASPRLHLRFGALRRLWQIIGRSSMGASYTRQSLFKDIALGFFNPYRNRALPKEMAA